MPSFTRGPAYRTPFGTRNFLRSTRDVKTTSATLAASSVPATTIDGVAGQKVLHKGTVLARMATAAAPDQWKVGPYDANATDGRQTAANIVGILNTELPWQTEVRDVEVAVVYECTAYQELCTEYTVAGGTTPQPLSDATATAMAGKKHMDIRFHHAPPPVGPSPNTTL